MIPVGDQLKHMTCCMICQCCIQEEVINDEFTPLCDGTQWEFTQCHPLIMQSCIAFSAQQCNKRHKLMQDLKTEVVNCWPSNYFTGFFLMFIVMCFGLQGWHHAVSEFKDNAIQKGAKNIDATDYPITMMLSKASEYLLKCK